MIITTKSLNKGLIALCLVCFEAHANDQDTSTLDTITVTASQQSLDEVVQPIKVLDKSQLQQASGTSLGEILETQAGIANASFGAGVGRPIIRGLSGNRVKVAVNGSDAADVSAMSSDHAPMAEAANAEQVEIIYGPGTLLFGSGAIGGVVNLVDGRVHYSPILDEQGNSTWEAKIGQSLSSNGSGSETSLLLDAGFGPNWVLHLDGVLRESENYDSEQGEELNTQTEAQAMNFGLSHLRSNGHGTLAVSVLDYEYGVPNPNNEAAVVSPYQLRIDGEYELILDSPLLESINLKASINDYEHEEGTDNLAVGFFEKDNMEIKSVFNLNHDLDTHSRVGVHINRQELGLCHDHSGCESGVPNYSSLNWDGSKGSNFFLLNDADGNTLEFAHDTPMPLSTTTDIAGFWIFRNKWSKGNQEFAIRIDDRNMELDPQSIRPASRRDSSYYDDQNFLSVATSAGWTWLTDSQKYGLAISRTERAPEADEMFWNGDHHATFSFQLDNPDLQKETAITLDLTWSYTGQANQLNTAIYYYDFDGFIYNKLQSLKDPFHGNDVYQYVQRDAYLTGFEVNWDYILSDSLMLTTSLDHAVGRLKSGNNKNLPRIPPISGLLGLRWSQGPWLLNGDVRTYAKQDKTSENEVRTDGYETLNASVGYHWILNKTKLNAMLKANNITDEFGRNHVSYLKGISAVPGRNISLDVQLSF